MGKVYKVTGESWSGGKHFQCQGSREIRPEEDVVFLCTETLLGLNQLPADAPVLLKRIK